MAVAVDHGCKAGGLRLQIQLCQVVQDINRNAADLNYFGFGQRAGPCSFIDVAPNCGERRNGFQLIENFRLADVPCMDDVVRTM